MFQWRGQFKMMAENGGTGVGSGLEAGAKCLNLWNEKQDGESATEFLWPGMWGVEDSGTRVRRSSEAGAIFWFGDVVILKKRDAVPRWEELVPQF